MYAALFASALACAASISQSPTGQRAPQIVATVGNAKIDAKQVAAEMNRLIPMTFYHGRVPTDKLDAFWLEARDQLIEKSLIFQDAEARGIPATEAELRAEFKKTLAKAGPRYKRVAPAEFDRLLGQFRARVRRRILLDKNEARFEKTIPVIGEARIRAAYEARKAKLLAPAEAQLQHIFVKVPPTATGAQLAALRGRIDDARELIAGGKKTFAEVARVYSDDVYAKQGGDMGFVKRGSFRQAAVDTAAFELKDGELSKILTSLYGFHLVRCVRRKPPRTLTFREARKDLARQLATETRAKARADWLAELRRRYPVKLLVEDAPGAAARKARHPASQPSKIKKQSAPRAPRRPRSGSAPRRSR